MAERFYVKRALGPGPLEITGDEAHHLAVVCRVRPGDIVVLFNGDGCDYPAAVVEVRKRSVAVEVQCVERPERELHFRLEVAAPLPKGDRAQFLIEKLTELGATAFTPLRTERSVVEPREAKLEKLQRHVIEACKQCGRNVLLDVRPLTDWNDFCRQPELPVQRILAHPGGPAFPKREVLTPHPPGWQEAATPSPLAGEGWGGGETLHDAVLAVGPEGGFTSAEVETAVASGWRVVGLGPRILRMETAALVLATLWGLGRDS
jgi:16S rRNA (uracil1498-N3)-methyltransferase